MVADKPKNAPPVPQRLSPDSRLTSGQSAFAHLFAAGLNSAADCYRKAYKRKATGEWWCRQQAYNLLQKPHVQALVTKLRAQYDTARPALTRAGKREILRDMAIKEELDPIDRQRAIDIDNKMAGEYQERMHLTADVTVSMFRSTGAIPWQLAENMPANTVSPSRSNGSDAIDVVTTNVLQPVPDGGTGTLAIPDSSQSEAIPSSPDSEPIPTPQPVSDRTPQRTGQAKPRAKLTPLQRAALRKPRGQQR